MQMRVKGKESVGGRKKERHDDKMEDEPLLKKRMLCLGACLTLAERSCGVNLG